MNWHSGLLLAIALGVFAMAAGSSACATLSRLCYLGRVLVRASRDGQAKPRDNARRCAIVGQTVSSVDCEASFFFAQLKPCGIGNPRRDPYRGRDRQRIPRLNREVPKPVQHPTWWRTGGDRR
jgi:hypothetical protein